MASQTDVSVPKKQHDFYRWQQQQEEEKEERRRAAKKRRRRAERTTRGSESDLWTWKTVCLVVGLLNYTAWVTTLVCCSPALFSTHGNNNGGKSSSNNNNNHNITAIANNTTRNGGLQPSLFFPLDVYAWAVGQSLSTLGILGPISEVLTHEAWKSFEKRDRHSSSSSSSNNNNNNIDSNDNNSSAVRPPTEIPVLEVQDFLGREDGGSAALEFLATTYGPGWRERPLLLRGLWTVEELTATGRGRRRLTPEGLLNTTDLVVPYFSDSSRPGALEPDASGPVGDIVRGMIEEDRPHKIGSQFVVQNDPSLMEEVAPLGFVRSLFGNHFSPDHLMGNPHRRGFRKFLPGTTTVPLFVANTRAVRRRRGGGGGSPDPTPDGEESPARGEECPVVPTEGTNDPGDGGDGDGSSCPNPRSAAPHDPNEDGDGDGGDDPATGSIPVTGLHCEPIANVAVQLWGSRTWTLVDPEHSWKLRPSISGDGRSFYPSWISPEDLAARVPRYVTTTTPGDALWLPTWTYHKVDYVYHETDGDGGDGADAQLSPRQQPPGQQQQQLLHAHHLSIGASLFHFRPIDYVRRNPLFALLLIPSLVRELAGIKTQ